MAARKQLAIGNRASRVYLRHPVSSDAPEFIALMRASRRLHGSWVKPPLNRTAFMAYLKKHNGIDSVAVVVCRKEDDALVGVINIGNIVRGLLQSAYLGYYSSARYARQGYMREGLILVLRYAFRALKLHRLEANIQPNNTASLMFIRSLGFKQEGYSERYLKIAGRWRDHERWALLCEQWLKYLH